MTLTVRQALPQDLEQVITLQTLAIETLCSSHYSGGQLESIIISQKAARHDHELVLLAELEGQLVGFASLVGFGWVFWHRFGQIGAVYVHPEFARRGIATQLMQAIEQVAISRQYQELTVMSSLNAVPFYQAQGYERLGETAFQGLSRVPIPCVQLRKLYGQTTPAPTAGLPAYLQWLVALLVLPLVLIL